jgi:TatD DNase family protein
MRLIDTHCHLYLEDFDPEQDELAQKAKDSGIDPASAKRRPDDD